MPGMDGTGPWGQGPLTGRGMGYCNPKAPLSRGVGFYGRGLGRGIGRGLGQGFGRGFGRGTGRGWSIGSDGYPQAYPEDYRAMDYPADRTPDRSYLQQRQEILEAELKRVKESLASLVEEEQ
ncbi:MAG TPA: DUF5320 domain-containing protein [Peptococcaceae bacterium]|nr:DUF5320 domain-containing protein [Peptococcaceae bacterium]